MTVPFAVRYFTAVSPPAAPLVAVLAILPFGAAILESIERGSSDWVLASIGLVQMFAASTGFSRHASRGYYDPVLLGSRRVSVALAHFTASASPGVASWIGCGVAQAIAAQSPEVPPFRAAGWATIFLVSAIPWAVSARSAPYLGGVLWVMVSVSLLLSGKLLVPFGLLQAQSGWAAGHPAAAIGLSLAFPLVIPSFEWPAASLAGLFGCALTAAAAGSWAIVRADYPLAEQGA
jgi:hypothetical protein